jgi:hypothetical protein
VPKYEGQDTCYTVAGVEHFTWCCSTMHSRTEHMEPNFVIPLTYMKGLLSSSSCSAGLKIWAVAETVPVNLRDVRSPGPVALSNFAALLPAVAH